MLCRTRTSVSGALPRSPTAERPGHRHPCDGDSIQRALEWGARLCENNAGFPLQVSRPGWQRAHGGAQAPSEARPSTSDAASFGASALGCECAAGVAPLAPSHGLHVWDLRSSLARRCRWRLPKSTRKGRQCSEPRVLARVHFLSLPVLLCYLCPGCVFDSPISMHRRRWRDCSKHSPTAQEGAPRAVRFATRRIAASSGWESVAPSGKAQA